jgi:medium-chain acyl-[acyl-carrier-protein] hydrolase
MSNSRSWFHVPRPVARPRVRLFCFAHAGGSAATFHRWPASLDEDVEVLGTELPGRGSRLREPVYRRMSELVAALVAAVEPRLDVPYALFGHSLGAAVAFELVRALRRAGAPLPAHLVVSARSAPQLPRTLPPLHGLPQAEFFRALSARYGVANGALGNAEMAALLYPPLQADMEIFETWAYQAEAPLATLITACVGSRDPTVTRDGIEAWREQTSAGITCHLLDGDHFYLLADPRPLLGIVRSRLSSVSRGALRS